MAGAGTVPGILLIGWWLNRQAICWEISELDWLRRWSLRWGAGGTDFRGADLTGTDFSGARLRHARFAGARLAGIRWRDARDLHLADTYGTVLQPRAVREALASGDGAGKGFAGLDLRGLNFSGMNLAGADFTDADLSGARFAEADLGGAKLTRAVLLGADLARARLTGASIGHWNIDRHTRFAGVVCDYVYLDESGQDRQPESGDFRPGEFEKLYQEIAHTVDFLIENPAQMDALLRSLAKIRDDFGDDGVAQVQKVERKDGGFKVSVEVPAELEETLRKEIRREFDVQVRALEAEHRYALLAHEKDAEHLRRERDSLEALLTRALSRPIETTIQVEAKAMTDNSRKIENSPITHAAVNLGDHAEVRNESRAGSPAAEIGPLLEQLRVLIRESEALPEALKTHALQQVDILHTAAAQPPAEARNAAIGPLEALKTVGTLAGGIGALVAAVGKMFGI